MATLSSVPNFSVSSHATRSPKIHFASAEPVSTKPAETKSFDVSSKPASVSLEQGDTLVKSTEKDFTLPTTPEAWTKHVLTELPESERTLDLEKALHAHFQAMQQIKAPFLQEMRHVIGPKAKEMSKPELATEVTKIVINDPLSDAAGKIREIQSKATAAALPVEHAFLKTQNEAVQKAYFEATHKATQAVVEEIIQKAAPNLAFDAAKPEVPAGFMNEFRKAFLKHAPKDTVAFMKQSSEHGTQVLILVKQFLSENNELATKFAARRERLAKVVEAKHDELDTRFEAKREHLARRFEAKRDELGTKFEAELGELSKKFRTHLQENNPFGEVFERFVTKKL